MLEGHCHSVLLTLFIMLTFFLIIEKRQSDHKKLPNWGQ